MTKAIKSFFPLVSLKLSILTGALATSFCLMAATVLAGALEDYVRQPDPHFNWKRDEQKRFDAGTITHLELVSQHWRDQFWSHQMFVVRPNTVRNPQIGLLLINGDGDGEKYLDVLKTLAERAGAVAAIINKVPNQPLYDGRKEDALIAYTFEQYRQTGNATWPLLFPMVKSAVRGMDTVQAFVEKEFHQRIEKFVVTGASKRGWTTWLTGAVDPRVTAIAPMVIDMLNMKVQLQWAKKVYGRQSEEIQDYTALGFDKKQDDPAMVKLRSWIDPYSYRSRYTMPKLLLLGTNDPYWTVDSLRNYWNDLPEPKLIFQTPNAGHDLGGGKEAVQTLAAFYEMIADGKELPKMKWEQRDGADGEAHLEVSVNQKAKEMRLWTATSTDRDFRDDKWSDRELEIKPGSSRATAEIKTPTQGYRAYLGEVELTAPDGRTYKLSTEARVTPDSIK